MNRIKITLLCLCVFSLSPIAKGIAQSDAVAVDTLGTDMSADSVAIDSIAIEQTVADSIDTSVTTAIPASVDSLTNDTLVYHLIPEAELPDSLIYSIAIYEELSNDSNFVLAYYPWKMVFDSHAVHRIDIYDKGISILNGLIETTQDSIQKEIYLDELMNVYDVWYELSDILNSRIDNPYSRGLIKSEKARRYIENMPLVYGLGLDSISSENVMEPYALRLYDYLKEAVLEHDGKGDIQYRLPDYFYSVARSRFVYYYNRHLKAMETFGAAYDSTLIDKHKEAYVADYNSAFASQDSLIFCLNDILGSAMLDNDPRIGVQNNQERIRNTYQDDITRMNIQSGDCETLEMEFENQFYEKNTDPSWLKFVIASLQSCQDSYIYLLALETYVNMIPEDEDMLADITKKRASLAKIYKDAGRYPDAIKQYQQLAADEKDSKKKALRYYEIADIYLKQRNYNNVVTNCRRAIKLLPEFANAYYYLGAAMGQLTWMKGDPTMNSFVQLLAIDKYEKALELVRANANDPALRIYNSTKESTILDAIESAKNAAPSKADAFFTGKQEGDVLNIFGEQVRVRFYK